MKGLPLSLLVATILSITSCSLVRKMDRLDFLELEKKGYSIKLDSMPINMKFVYLDEANISKVSVDKQSMEVNITRKNISEPFYSMSDLRKQNNYLRQIDVITINGLVLDDKMMSQLKFEHGSVKYIRLLTQKDYAGKDFDDLPQVKQMVGNGILIIETE